MQKGKLLLGPENQSTIPEDGIKYLSSKGTVHDMENLTFSEEFCGCSVRNDADLPQGGRRSSGREDMNFPQIRVEMAETRRQTSCATTMEGSKKTSQGSFKLSL